MQREAILLTPGPLTTTLRTKLAMLKDWGSWDADFNAVTARVRSSLLAILHGADSHVVVPLQGSGTFSVEAAVATLVPHDGHVLVLDNGAYCKRAARLSTLMGRKVSSLTFDEAQPVDAALLESHLQKDRSVTHVVLIHCETGAGVLNPLQAVADVMVIEQHFRPLAQTENAEGKDGREHDGHEEVAEEDTDGREPTQLCKDQDASDHIQGAVKRQNPMGGESLQQTGPGESADQVVESVFSAAQADHCQKPESVSQEKENAAYH